MQSSIMSKKPRKEKRKKVRMAIPDLEATQFIPQMDTAPSPPPPPQAMQRWDSRDPGVQTGNGRNTMEMVKTVVKTPMFIVASASLMLLGLGFWAHKKLNLFASPEEEIADKPIVTEEDQAVWRAEQVALEKTKMRDAVDNLRTKMAGVQSELQRNQQEAAQNEQNYKRLFSGEEGRVGHDDDLSNMETESNLNTAFMLKEDLENKKAGMVTLGKELGLNHQSLLGELGKIKEALHHINNSWTEQYQDEEPLFMESASAPPIPNGQQA